MADPREIAAAMDRLWSQFAPQMAERVAILETAAAAAVAGTLTAQQCDEAMREAHKLAGVLGTFGLPLGSELAREAESCYAAGTKIDPALADRLVEIAVQLRAVLSSRG